ncbi:hypothetical protein HMPREF1015_01444 [Bacillus smithii 7_3_47FAA]|uniref:Uncharacterized protein n=1 Tax=Bacillus smithii 7_3_47FAA TaxID=665952 RepID=G9QI80_9BACI|nr:hypothetical protein HMPREF1015_01444 [Bacillus smithii 7_3_47FAA]
MPCAQKEGEILPMSSIHGNNKKNQFTLGKDWRKVLLFIGKISTLPLTCTKTISPLLSNVLKKLTCIHSNLSII